MVIDVGAWGGVSRGYVSFFVFIIFSCFWLVLLLRTVVRLLYQCLAGVSGVSFLWLVVVVIVVLAWLLYTPRCFCIVLAFVLFGCGVGLGVVVVCGLLWVCCLHVCIDCVLTRFALYVELFVVWGCG